MWRVTICCVILARPVHLSGPPFSQTPCPACSTKGAGRLQRDMLGICCEHWITPRGQFLSRPAHFPLHMLFLPPGHPSPPIPRGSFIILEIELTGHRLWEALLPGPNCGHGLHGPLSQHMSQTQGSLAGHAPAASPCGSLTRGGLIRGHLGAPAPGTELALSLTPALFPPVTVSCWIAVWWQRLARTRAE